MSKKLIEDIYPLSPMQEGMLYHYIANPKTKEYFDQMTYELQGNLDIGKLELAWNYVIQNCGVLRTIFQWKEVKAPVQIVLIKRPMKIEVIDLTVEVKPEQTVVEIKAGDLERGFDLERGPLTRITVCRLSAERHILIWSFHHIILDGWSMAILQKDTFMVYNQLLSGQSPELAPKLQYKEYIKFLLKQDRNSAIEYWKQYLQNFTEPTYWPVDFPRKSTIQAVKETVYALEVDQYQKIQQLAKRYKVTENIVFQIAWGILLRKYTFSEDVVFGATVSGRPHELDGITESVGLFINTVPVRVAQFKDQTIAELLQRHMADSFERKDYEYLSLTDIHAQSEIVTQLPLFDHIIVFQNYPFDESLRKANPAGLQSVGMTTLEMTSFDLVMIVVLGDTLKIRFNYNPDTIKEETIARLFTHLRNILAGMLANPDAKVGELEMLSVKEKEQLLGDARSLETEDGGKCIHQLFEAQVAKTPDAIALVFEGATLTYEEVNQRANKLARRILKEGIGPDMLVGLMVQRSLEMIIGILAILKAGGAYLPIDPEYPGERIEYMLQESGARVLLTQDKYLQSLDFAGTIINIQDPHVYSSEGTNLVNVNIPRDLVYVIFTSGSTGKPKGVMIEHQNVANLLQFEYAKTNVDYRTKVLQFASISFDVSFQEIFSTLLAGGQLYLVSQERRDQIPKLLEYVDEEGIEVLFLPTALVKYIFNEAEYSGHIPESIKHIIVAGEQLVVSAGLREYIRQNHIFLHNHYGPSETHVVTTLTLGPDEEIDDLPTIGQPIDNTQIYILDRDGHLQTTGVAGELCIAGKNVGRGYLNRAELTQEKFVPNFFSAGRLYRTGDIARWKEDGTIEFLGRMDHQVKIRGFRIELGEIESALLNHPQIREVAVIDHKDAKNSAYLVAYYVAEAELTVAEFREFLAQRVPDYMIPGYFIKLAQIPLNSNGKIDRRAVPIPDGRIVTGTQYVAPRNSTEERLAKIWSELLQVERVGINDHFFELGGHSLKATALVARIYKEFNVEIAVQQIFSTPELKDLAELIVRSQKGVFASIEPVEERNYYPVSSAQKRLYIVNQFDDQNTSYNLPRVLLIEGKLDQVTCKKAFEKLIQRHESLRTSFHTIEGEIVQKIHPTVKFEMLVQEATEAGLKDLVTDFVRPFDLSQAPLLRVGLVQLPERQVLLYDMHHIIADGVSMNLLITDFIQAYQGQELPRLRLQYKDFAVWQNELFNSEQIEKQEKYWVETFAGEIPVLNLPTDYPRPREMNFEGAVVLFEIAEKLRDQYKQLAAEQGATLYMVFLAAYNLLLAKYTGQEDIVVGSSIAGRPHADLEKIIGMFVNTLAMRNTLHPNQTFIEYLTTVKANAFKAYENQDYPFEKLVNQLNLARNLSKNPLFDTFFAYLNTGQVELVIDDIKFTPYYFEGIRAKFDLTLHSIEMEHGIWCSLEYCKELFKEETVARMARHYLHILEAIIENPDRPLAEIELITEVEKLQILQEFNNTLVEYPKTKTIQQLFEEQVQLTPEQVALVSEGVSMSYQMLNARANQLARVLRTKGVGRERVVAIMSDKSLEMIIGVLAIVKAGGAYLPIDMDYPPARVEYMLKDAGAELLLTQKDLLEKISFAGEKINLEDVGLYQGDIFNLEMCNQPEDLIYIIYTSGSTGNPKGVMVTHVNVNRLISNSNMLVIRGNERILQTGSLAFDASTFEIWGALLNGASLFLITKDDLLSAERFERKMQEYQITMIWLTAPLFNQMIEENPAIFANLQTLIVGGDALSPRHIKLVRTKYPDLCVINGYGPTESTTFTTYYKMDADNLQTSEYNIPIGKPVSNTQVYIVNANACLQPIGVPGELCVSGDGLARGYLNHPELTAENFVANPFYPEEKMYRTGDLARWLPDGNIEFLGRMDQQVKIRGYRIELGEIENQLLQHPAIKEAVVLDRKDQAQEKYLCAYFVRTAENAGTAERELASLELKAFLQTRLPEYMIPAYFVQLEQIPLTANGKVNRKALQEVEEQRDTQITYVAPGNEVEERLAKIWSELLGVLKIGVTDNFFALGGHSLKATKLVALVHKEFNVEMSLKDIFQAPTVAGLAKVLQTREQSVYCDISKLLKREYYELSFAQRRLWIINQLEPGSIAYHMPSRITLAENVDQEVIKQVFKLLVDRHESLRTIFKVVEGEPVQQILKELPLPFSYVDLSGLDDAERAIERERIYVENAQKPFNLEEGPLFRVALVRLRDAEFDLIFVMHHIISDGWSTEVLQREFAQCYDSLKMNQAIKLPDLPIQYKDFAAWQNQLLRDEGKLQEVVSFWSEQLRDELPILRLPYDSSPAYLKNRQSAGYRFVISAEVQGKLKKLATEHNASLFMLLLAGYNLLLARITNQTDILLGIPAAGREHENLKNIIGFFINTVILRNRINLAETFCEYVKKIQQTTLQALEYQVYPLEMIFTRLKMDYPKIPTFFNLLNFYDQDRRALENLKSYHISEVQDVKFDFVCYLTEYSNGIEVNCHYLTGLFDPETIEYIMGEYQTLLKRIADNPESNLEEYVARKERQKILF